MFLRNSILFFCLFLLCCGCFKEDTPIDPVTRNGIRIKNSMYNFQTFYDLSSNSSSTNPNGSWDLAFENTTDGWHIRINYSNFSGVYRTGSTDFNATSYTTEDKNWIYDASSGNPDSTAVGNWRDTTSEGPLVYLIGTYDGIRYKPYRKIKFSAVTDTSYMFTFANFDNSDVNEFTIKKNPSFNNTYFSFKTKDTLSVEPSKNNWDILFTQYTTTLFTKEGIATPYIVRGIYVNPGIVSAMVDSLTGYANITSGHIDLSKMSSIQDNIGYNWKAVEINQSANTARYAVRKNYSYIIRDTEGVFYKLHFLTYVNDSLLVGYPMFEKERLE